MVATRQAIIVVLVSLGSACSSGSSVPSGNGGAGSGGIGAHGGAAGAAELAGSAGGGAIGGLLGTGGTGATGGASLGESGGVGATGGGLQSGGAGGAGQAGSGGRSESAGGAPSAGAAGHPGTAGRSGSAGAGMGGSPADTGGVAGGGMGGGSGSGGAGGTVESAGCGKTRTLQNGTIKLTFNNASRQYILHVPDGYDDGHPYRLVLAYAWSGASASQVVSADYFTFATLDPKDTIFAAPDAADGAGTWSGDDVAFTDAILAQLEGDLCIDTTRRFATGFSFGGAMAMALGCTRAEVFRAVAFFSGADLTNSCPTTLTQPIAYYASQASEDSNGLSTTSPITGEKRQADFAAVNGCMPEPSSTVFPASGQPHTCTNYKGCSAGHPTEYCVFNGPHGWDPKDPGQSMSWNAPEAWKFITQF